MKKLFYLTLILSLFMVSCDNDDDKELGNDDDNNPELQDDEIVKIKLYQESGATNIFELITFRIYPERNTSLLELKGIYDSLVWTVTDLGRFKIFSSYTNDLGTGTDLAWLWSHNFFVPKKYETVLVGYKDNKVIMTDTLFVNVVNKKDFLSFNWKDITQSSLGSMGYQNVFLDHSDFSTNYAYEAGSPSIDLFVSYNNKIDEVTLSEYSRETLMDLMTELYSEPKYSSTENPDEIEEQYNNLFKNKREGDVEPLSIWLTQKSRIVLLKYYGVFLTDAPEYKIHAEPNY